MISPLIELAKTAKPPAVTHSKSKWSTFFPVLDQLRANGFSAWDATRWLVERGAVPAEKRRVCYHSFLGYIKRANRK
jgi:Tat protein secretion system quality control protein TatD with DNase activity